MTAIPQFSVALASVLATALCCSAPARAADNLESECQSEARLYEIPEEQMADYVAGCVASRGGYSVTEPAEDTVAQDAGDAADPSSDETVVEEYTQ